MREIKFRAWDKENKIMMDDYQWIDSRDPHMGGGVHRSFQYLRNGRNRCNGKTSSAAHEIIQFTGLKDKNGKDWFGGDLAKAPSGIIFKTYFSDDHMGWKLSTPDGIYNINAALYEIVGNIYENPELL